MPNLVSQCLPFGPQQPKAKCWYHIPSEGLHVDTKRAFCLLDDSAMSEPDSGEMSHNTVKELLVLRDVPHLTLPPSLFLITWSALLPLLLAAYPGDGSDETVPAMGID